MLIRLTFCLILVLKVALVNSVTILNASVSAQTVVSPNYPGNYPRNVDEYWFLSTSTLDSSLGSWVLNLEVVDFRFEEHSSCAYDYLEIFDGDSEYAISFGRLCGSQSALVYSSTGPSLYFHLHSDYSVTYRGFSITYWATYTAFAIVTQAPKSNPRRDNSYQIIGGILGSVTGLCLIGIIIYCVCRRRYRKKERTRKTVKKVFKFDKKGKIRPVYKTTFHIPDTVDDGVSKTNIKSDSTPSSVSTVSDPKPTTSKKPTRTTSAPPESYLYWGRQVPNPFKYIEPSYPAGHGSTPY